MKLDILIPKDTIVLFSSGEYSDYNCIGLYKAVEDIKPEEIRNEYINLCPEQTGQYDFKYEVFQVNLYLLKIQFEVPGLNWTEWYLGGYHLISGMRVYAGPIMFN